MTTPSLPRTATASRGHRAAGAFDRPPVIGFLIRAFLLFLVPGLIATTALAQVSILGSATTVRETSGSQFTKTMSYTLPAGSNRLLVVASSGDANLVGTPTVTFNGTTMTVGSVATSGTGRTGMWYLPMGTSGTSTTANVVITYSSSFIFDLTAVAFQNVDQSTPVSGATTSSTQSLSVSSASGDLVLDSISGYTSTTVAVTAGQMVLSNNNNLLFGDDPDAGFSARSGATSVTMAWTGYISGISHAGMNLKQAAAASPPTITTASLPSYVVGAGLYAQTVSATGGTGSYTFSIQSGTIPFGLTFTAGGVFSGFPTTTGTYNFTVLVTDSGGATATKALTISVTGTSIPLAISTSTLPNPGLNTAGYSQTIAVTGGAGSTTFGVTSGTLPTGLTLSSGGVLSGTATVAGTFNFTITATDAASATASRAFSLVVASSTALAISTTTLPNPTLNANYTQTVVAVGGSGAITFSVVPGTLPSGLFLSLGGTISGVPTLAGSYTFTITAVDLVGTIVSRSFTLVVAAPTPVTIATTSLPAYTLGNGAYVQSVTATGGSGVYTYLASGGSIPTGLTFSTAGVFSGMPTTAGIFNFTVVATDSLGAIGSRAFSIVVSATLNAQTITFAALPDKIATDAPFTLAATANSGLPVTFSVTGPATLSGNTLTLTGTPGVVTVTASRPASGSFAAAPNVVQTFNVAAASAVSRIINLSARVQIAPDPTRSLIAGFVITGSQSKRVLIRAVGPALTPFGVAGALVNPKLQLFNSSGAVILENDDWSGTDTAAAFAQVGAFPLPASSKDAALVTTLAPGSYTMQITAGSETGVALAEIYDASVNPTAETQRLINISTRGMVGVGEGILVGGFVVTGNAPKRVLIRGIGPRLAGFGVAGALADPSLAIYSGQTVIAQNDNWSVPVTLPNGQTPATAAELSAVAQSVGAFALGAGSLDASVYLTLPPGSYTAQVSGVGSTTGVALVEIYEAP